MTSGAATSSHGECTAIASANALSLYRSLDYSERSGFIRMGVRKLLSFMSPYPAAMLQMASSWVQMPLVSVGGKLRRCVLRIRTHIIA